MVRKPLTCRGLLRHSWSRLLGNVPEVRVLLDVAHARAERSPSDDMILPNCGCSTTRRAYIQNLGQLVRGRSVPPPTDPGIIPVRSSGFWASLPTLVYLAMRAGILRRSCSRRSWGGCKVYSPPEPRFCDSIEEESCRWFRSCSRK